MNDADAISKINIEETIDGLIDQGKQPEALLLAKEFVDHQPQNSEAYFVLASAHSSWNQHEKAVDDLKQAIDINPSEGKYYNMLGSVYMEIGCHKAALNEYNHAVNISPGNLTYITNLSKAKSLQGNIISALADIEKFQPHQNDNEINNNIAEVYLAAVYQDWHYDKNTDQYFPTCQEHIKTAEQHLEKAKSFSLTNKDLQQKIATIESSVQSAQKRTFSGGWGTLISAFIFSGILYFANNTLGYIFGISALAYYFALLTPVHVYNKNYYGNHVYTKISDRITSLFLIDDDTFYRQGFSGDLKTLNKTRLIISVIRKAARLSFLPITVTAAFLNNYSKNHAFSFIAFLATFIIAINASNAYNNKLKNNARSLMINAVNNNDINNLSQQINQFPTVFQTNSLKLIHLAVRSQNITMLDFLIPKSQKTFIKNVNSLLDIAIDNDKLLVVEYLSNNTFKKSKEFILSALDKEGPYKGNYSIKKQEHPILLQITATKGDTFDGIIEYPNSETQTKDTTQEPTTSSIEVIGLVIANKITLIEGITLSGAPLFHGCDYNLRLEKNMMVGHRQCPNSQDKHGIQINLQTDQNIKSIKAMTTY